MSHLIEYLMEQIMEQNETKVQKIHSQIEGYKIERARILAEASKIKDKTKLPWKMCIEKYDLGTRFGIDLSIVDIEIRNLQSEIRQIEKTNRPFAANYLGSTFYAEKASNKQKNILEKEICSICLDTHKATFIVRTRCCHYFGVCCLEQNILHALDNNNIICCPLCRSTNILPVKKYI